jgi:hypothetical protein
LQAFFLIGIEVNEEEQVGENYRTGDVGIVNTGLREMQMNPLPRDH